MESDPALLQAGKGAEGAVPSSHPASPTTMNIPEPVMG